jgi:hypothetical protein
MSTFTRFERTAKNESPVEVFGFYSRERCETLLSLRNSRRQRFRGVRGFLSVTIDGILITIPTFPGDTPELIAERLAVAINADPALQALGVFAPHVGPVLQLNSGITFRDFVITDPGISINFNLIPILSRAAGLILLMAMMLTGLFVASQEGQTSEVGPGRPGGEKLTPLDP